MTISKNVCNDEVDRIISEYNDTVRSTIKMKSNDITRDAYTDYNSCLSKKKPIHKYMYMYIYTNIYIYIYIYI